jgi:alkylation response protein AidB-like acyl-CoA dehydrogenase
VPSTDEAVTTARRVATEVLAPNADRWDADAAWPVEGVRALQAAGLGGLVAPREAGGMGLGLRALTGVCEALGEVDASCALCFGMHRVGVACISSKARPEQVENLLVPICAGEHITTLALSEPEAGNAGHPDSLPAMCSAQAEVARASVDIVNEGMTQVGGIAYRDGSVLQRLLRDARAAHVMSPTTDLLYTWTGRALLDIPLLGDRG